VDVLDRSAIDVDTLSLEALLGSPEDVRKKFLCVTSGSTRVTGRKRKEKRRTSACMSFSPPRKRPMGVRREVTIYGDRTVNKESDKGRKRRESLQRHPKGASS
jgi:hypothetical protein